MGNITLSIPNDVHEEMRQFSDVKWSEVARRAIVERLETLKPSRKYCEKKQINRKRCENSEQKDK